MAFVEIYHKKNKIGTEHFRLEFYIIESLSGEIYWYTGEQPKSGGGEIKIWVQRANTVPRILTVLPDWQLFIDGVRQESKFYDSVENLSGKVVELRHKDYRFVFRFDL